MIMVITPVAGDLDIGRAKELTIGMGAVEMGLAARRVVIGVMRGAGTLHAGTGVVDTVAIMLPRWN